jgi:hypothetical protein
VANLDLIANNLGSAESNARQALAVYAQSLPARHLFVAATHQLLGEVLLRRGFLQPAETEFRAALDIDMALAGPGNWRTARTDASLGWALIMQDRAAEGEPKLVAAQRLLVATLGSSHPEAVQASSRLAEYYRMRHRDAEAARVPTVTDKH